MKTTTYRASAVAALAALTLSACGGTTVKSADTTSTTSATSTSSTSSESSTSTTSSTTSETSSSTTSSDTSSSSSSSDTSSTSSDAGSGSGDSKDNGATDNKRAVPNYYLALSKNDPEAACGTMASSSGTPFYTNSTAFNACVTSIRGNLSKMDSGTRSAMALVTDSEVHSTGSTSAYAYPIALGKAQTTAKFGLVEHDGKWYINSAGRTGSTS